MLVNLRRFKKSSSSSPNYTNYTLLILRLVTGTYLVSSGLMGGMLSIVDPMDISDVNFEIYSSLQIAAGTMLLSGLFTRVGSMLMLGLFASTFAIHGLEALDQIMLLGVGIALILKGGGSKYSLDRIMFGNWNLGKSLIKKIDTERLFLLAIGIAFGANLIWLGLMEKILVPDMFAAVMEKFGMTPIGVDPQLAVFGAGIIEIAIGMMYLLRMRMRIVSAMMFGILVFTVVTFQESILAHIVMFGISAIFLVNGKDSIIGIDARKVTPVSRQIKNVLLLRMYPK